MSGIRFALLASLALACNACRMPEPPPTDEPPEPQAATGTELRDAIRQPIDKAKAAGDAVQEAADKQRAAIDAATD